MSYERLFEDFLNWPQWASSGTIRPEEAQPGYFGMGSPISGVENIEVVEIYLVRSIQGLLRGGSFTFHIGNNAY